MVLIIAYSHTKLSRKGPKKKHWIENDYALFGLILLRRWFLIWCYLFGGGWMASMNIHIYIYKTRTKVFPPNLVLQPSPLPLRTGCTWMTWRIADQLVCFKRILIYSDLKYDPPRRPREMRIIDPRRSMMIIIRDQTRKNFLPPDEHFPLNNFVFWWTFSTTKNCVLMSMVSFTALQMVILNADARACSFESSLRGNMLQV